MATTDPLPVPLLRLAGALPAGAASRLGRRLGASWPRARSRRAAMARLARALAVDPGGSGRRLLRRSLGDTAAGAAAAIAWPRRELRSACRHVVLEGWNEIASVAENGTRALFLCAEPGAPAVAAWALAVYAPPVHLLREPTAPAAWQLAGEALARHRDVSLVNAEEAVERLAEGARVVAPLAWEGRSSRRSATFFGRPSPLAAASARLATAAHAAIVPIFALPTGGTGWRVAARRPLTGAGDELAAACLAAVEAMVRDHPTLWPWLLDPWERRR